MRYVSPATKEIGRAAKCWGRLVELLPNRASTSVMTPVVSDGMIAQLSLRALTQVPLVSSRWMVSAMLRLPTLEICLSGTTIDVAVKLVGAMNWVTINSLRKVQQNTPN